MKKRLAIIGSTGSIGQNTLKVVRHLSDRFEVFALAAHSSVDLLAEQIEAYLKRLRKGSAASAKRKPKPRR